MAKENVKKFFEAVSKSEDLQKQLKEATQKKEAEIAKAVKAQTETLVDFAKKAGFDFTAEELLSGGAPEGSKLDINELDAVAGGAHAGHGGFCIFLGVTPEGPGAGAGFCINNSDTVGVGACAYYGIGFLLF